MPPKNERARARFRCISTLEISCQAPTARPPPAPATGSSTTSAAHVDPAPLPPQSVANIRSEGGFTHRFEDPRKSPKRYKVRPTRQVCGQHGRYWPVLSSCVMCGPVPRRGTAWRPRRWSSGAVDVVIIVRSREQSACISALEIACQTPRIGPAPAPATGSSTTRPAYVQIQHRSSHMRLRQLALNDKVWTGRALTSWCACDATEEQVSRYCLPVTC